MSNIRGIKFLDNNSDGIQQPGEPGLQGWTIFLDENDNGILDNDELRTITDANGNYDFSNLDPGRYTVREILQPGFEQTTPPETIVITANIVNIGNAELPVNISGVKFLDSNENGIRDGGEPGLQGFTIFLDANNNGVLDNNERSAVTGPNGSYSFTNLDAGTYNVRAVHTDGFVATGPDLVTVSLTPGQSRTNVNFGCIEPVSSISGVKFLDANENGIRDGGEQGLGGWTIFLDANNNNILDNNERSTITGPNGNYRFDGLDAGTYNVREVQQVGFQQTTSNPTIVLPAGQDRTGVNFGNAELPVNISGVKFLDSNENGIRDGGEPGLQGFTIFLDANNNNILDNNERSTITGPNGNYSFTGLDAGTYN
ncbi:MAG: SdrD B-like domain-containing protein, partial [Hormoscilla sp.]